MKYAHLIRLTVFSYENEDLDKISQGMLDFFPFSLEDSKIIPGKTAAEGFSQSKIIILEVTLAKSSLINDFLRNLAGALDEEQKNLILLQAESRLDKNLDFFLRFDKDPWIYDKKLVLTDSGKCFHLKISIAAFPRKREVALNIIKKILISEIEN